MIRTNKPAKPNKCKYCKKPLPEEIANYVLHPSCIVQWLDKHNALKAAKAKAKLKADKAAERADDKRRKEKLKNRSDWMKEVKTAFHAFIRARDAGRPCICCGKPFEPQRPGGSVDAGHYLGVGAAPHLRFVENNVHAQRKNCNRPGGTTRASFRAGMIERIGLAAVESLESDQKERNYTVLHLIDLKALYVAKLKALRAAA